MADGEELHTNNVQNIVTDEPKDDVFVNGDAGTIPDANLLHPEAGNLGDDPLPRRSSMIKNDGARRQARKKTVSFSSMPTEKKIVNGKSCCLSARCIRSWRRSSTS